MINTIGIFTDDNSMTLSMDENGIFQIYVKVNEQWTVKEKITFGIEQEKGIAHVRQQFRDLAVTLENCDVIIAKKINGLAYTILDPKGFELWEIDGPVEAFLEDAVREAEAEVKEESVEALMTPQKINEGGCYFINLKEVMKKLEGEKSSKQIMMPILEKRQFLELSVICSHVPPWFEKVLDGYGLMMEVTDKGSAEKEVVIKGKVCQS